MQVLLISGSTRAASTNRAALAALQATAPAEVSAVGYDGLADLPAFNPDLDRLPLPVAVSDLRAAIDLADVLVLCTPEYAGTLPGSLKNLLDWTVGGTEISGKPTAWVNVAATGRGHGAIATLETVLGYVGADLIRPACRDIPVARDAVDENGVVTDPVTVAALAGIWTAISEHLT
jgi:chromate reductase